MVGYAQRPKENKGIDNDNCLWTGSSDLSNKGVLLSSFVVGLQLTKRLSGAMTHDRSAFRSVPRIYDHREWLSPVCIHMVWILETDNTALWVLYSALYYAVVKVGKNRVTTPSRVLSHCPAFAKNFRASKSNGRMWFLSCIIDLLCPFRVRSGWTLLNSSFPNKG